MARESSQIVPPSGLRVNRQSAVPVHVQLQTQIRHLISTGGLKPGMQLPTVRQLAGFLRINRNTVARALADLSQDGFLESRPGLGTFVVERPPAREGRAARSLERLVADALDRARQLGFTQEELLATVASHAPQRTSPRGSRARALLIECNHAELSRYRDQLEAELPLRVERMLVEEFEARAPKEPTLLKGCRVVITTFFHIHEVKRAMPDGGPPTMALLAEASIFTLLRLTELPEGSTVGLVCTSSKGSQNLLRSVQSAGLLHLDPVLASVDDQWSIDRMLEKTRTVVCSEQSVGALLPHLPTDAELIVSDRILEPGGLELLRDLLAREEARP